MEISRFIHETRERAFLVGDYSTYRTQLSKQLHKTRKTLGRATPKNSKQLSSKTPITAEDVGSNPAFAHLQLLIAERAWAFAMAMKAAHGETEQGMPGSTRSHILSRLAKAAKAAEYLSSMLKDDSATTRASQNDILEARAYASTLHGAHEFEKHVGKAPSADASTQKSTWAPCLQYFATAHVIYATLLHSTKSEVFKELLGSVDPSIRYAAYQARYPRSVAPNQVAKTHFPREDKALVKSVETLHPAVLSSEEKQAKVEAPDGGLRDVPTTVTWRGRTAPIADATIGQALAATSLVIDKLVDIVSETARKPVGPHTPNIIATAYDDVLGAAQDTVDNVRRAIAELSREGVAESDSRMQDLRVTDLAVNYELIAWRVGRNRVLMSSSDSASVKDGVWQRDDGLVFKATQLMKKGKDVNGDTSMDEGQLKPKEEPIHKQLARLTARVKLYDLTLQSVGSAASLRGAARDSGFQSELATKREYFSSLRCLNIAVSHKVLGREKEALALFNAASKRADAISPDGLGASNQTTLDDLKLGVSPNQLAALKSHLSTLLRKQHGLVALQEQIKPLSAPRGLLNTNTTDAASPAEAQKKQQGQYKPPLVNNLDQYPSQPVDLTNLVTYPPKIEPVPVKPIFLDLAWNYIDYPGRGKAAAQESVEGGKEEPQKKKGWFGFGR